MFGPENRNEGSTGLDSNKLGKAVPCKAVAVMAAGKGELGVGNTHLLLPLHYHGLYKNSPLSGTLASSWTKEVTKSVKIHLCSLQLLSLSLPGPSLGICFSFHLQPNPCLLELSAPCTEASHLLPCSLCSSTPPQSGVRGPA